jgi:hypothetical protein
LKIGLLWGKENAFSPIMRDGWCQECPV